MFKVQDPRFVWLFTLVVGLVSIIVPITFINFFLPPWAPTFVRVPIYIVLVSVPLLVATPLTFIGLQMFLKLNQTVETLDHHIKYDPLTGLLSRSFFLSSVETGRKSGGYFMMLDVDHFKSINDTHGHDAGDEALKVIARVLNGFATGIGFAGRLGGEEFAVYLPSATACGAETLAQRINQAVRDLAFEAAGRPVPLSISIGLAQDAANLTLSRVMKLADLAMYDAKAGGRDSYVVCKSQMSGSAMAA